MKVISRLFILFCGLAIVSSILESYMSGISVSWKSYMLLVLIVVAYIRELQFDRIARDRDKLTLWYSCTNKAVHDVCDKATRQRLVTKTADYVIEEVPDYMKDDMRKINEVCKRIFIDK